VHRYLLVTDHCRSE